MSDEKEKQTNFFNIVSLYCKDSSLEVPAMPKAVLGGLEDASPSLDIRFDVVPQKTSKRENTYIVDITVHFEVKDDEKKELFMTGDMTYGTVCETDETSETLARLLYIEAPTQLFPLLRASVMLLTRETALPPVMLPYPSFPEMFEERKKQGLVVDFLK